MKSAYLRSQNGRIDVEKGNICVKFGNDCVFGTIVASTDSEFLKSNYICVI